MSGDKKGRETFGVKIVSWNINGIRSLYNENRDLKNVLDSLDADIICLQETKITRSTLQEQIAIVEGYNSYFGFTRIKSGYSGVATYCKDSHTPHQAEEGLTGLLPSANAADLVGCYGDCFAKFSKHELGELDYEGRAVITAHKVMVSDGEKMMAVINVYCPRAEKENQERLQVKLKFYKLLQERINALSKMQYLVVVVGDLNTAHKLVDVCEYESEEQFNENPCRIWLDKIIYDPSPDEMNNNANAVKLVDAFRFVNPSAAEAFTCWSSKLNARSTNYGTRIDYILVDMKLHGDIGDCCIMKDVLGSDHCPVKAIINITTIRAQKSPSSCTKYYPEFSGIQKRLTDFIKVPAEREQKCTDSREKHEKGPPDRGVKRQKTITGYFRKTQTCSADDPCSTKNVPLSTQNFSHSPTNVPHLSTISPPFTIHVPYSSKVPNSSNEVPNSEEIPHSIMESLRSKSSPEAGSAGGAWCFPKGESSSSQAWKNLLTGPKPAPPCFHGEPCVQRVVKKKGVNLNRRFWVCARAGGREGDPETRCQFFVWNSDWEPKNLLPK